MFKYKIESSSEGLLDFIQSFKTDVLVGRIKSVKDTLDESVRVLHKSGSVLNTNDIYASAMDAYYIRAFKDALLNCPRWIMLIDGSTKCAINGDDTQYEKALTVFDQLNNAVYLKLKANKNVVRSIGRTSMSDAHLDIAAIQSALDVIQRSAWAIKQISSKINDDIKEINKISDVSKRKNLVEIKKKSYELYSWSTVMLFKNVTKWVYAINEYVR